MQHYLVIVGLLMLHFLEQLTHSLSFIRPEIHNWISGSAIEGSELVTCGLDRGSLLLEAGMVAIEGQARRLSLVRVVEGQVGVDRPDPYVLAELHR